MKKRTLMNTILGTVLFSAMSSTSMLSAYKPEKGDKKKTAAESKMKGTRKGKRRWLRQKSNREPWLQLATFKFLAQIKCNTTRKKSRFPVSVSP